MVSLADVEQAQRVLRGVVDRTHLIYGHSLSRVLGCRVHLKLEMFQHTGGFTLRGAAN